ncbi:MAG: hypothetical protein ACQET5_05150 [Halobacteriota archaeon]
MHHGETEDNPIRENQDEWIEDQRLNHSSFVREQLDELIEERE